MRRGSSQRGRRLPEVLTAEEQAALLAQPNPRYRTGERNRLMLTLMLNTGLRLSEATGLQWRDLDLNTGKLFVRQGKGSKDRTLWIGGEDIKALQHWKQRQANEVCIDCPHVFSTLKGERVSSRYVQQMVKRYSEKAGIRKRVHPHCLRHSFASDLLRNIRNNRLVQKALGHANLSKTMVYTHVFDAELMAEMRHLRAPSSVG